MKLSYSDITSRIESSPTWYDENGVPRYTEVLDPEEASIYTRYTAFMYIACQACGRRFTVAQTVKLWDNCNLPDPVAAADPSREPWEAVNSFHYGDPPSHGCSGDTMSSVPLRIIAFWERASGHRSMRERPEFVFSILSAYRMAYECRR